MTITAETVDTWPFTVPEGELACEDDSVTFEVDGTIYAINGFALQQAEAGQDWVDIRESDIWASYPDDPVLRVDIGDVLDLGLELCQHAS